MPTSTIKNGAQWTVREGYESITDRLDLDSFSSGVNKRRYKLIKENRVRSVISMPKSDVSTNGIYIKYFKSKGYSNYVKYLFVPARTKTEWEVGNVLLSKNINTALPLAIAKKRTCSLLVTDAVTNSEEFMRFCQANFEGASLSEDKETEKKKLLYKLARFIRDIHEKGIFHCDLHAGNILIKFKNKQSSSIHDCDLYLMDLHRVKILNRMSCRKRRYNLAQIFNSLSTILTESDKLDFLRSYGSNTLGDITGEDELLRQIELQSSRIRNIHYRSRLKRCLKESSVFSKKRSIGMKTFFRKGYNTASLPGLIEKHHNALVSSDKAKVMKRDSKTALTRLPLKNKKIQSVVVKQYKVSCVGCLIKNIFRHSAGRKAWVAGNGLSVYGFNTPEPLALMEKKVLGITANSYLIMEDARDCLEIDRYILKHFHGKSLSKLKKKRVLINDLAETIGRMHNQNIFHHDLKTCNIMVKGKDKSPYITFLDFDKVSFEEEITIRKRVKNLTQMNLSTPKLISITDRLRFLKEYLRQCSIIDEKKNILRQIVNLSKSEKILYVSSNGDVTEDW